MNDQSRSMRRFVQEEMKISTNELEYFAETEEVVIVPRFRFDPITLLQRNKNDPNGQFGPFVPLTSVTVPLWLALQLKQQKFCTITLPLWLTMNSLEETLESERSTRETNLLSKVHFYYQEIAKLLLDHSPESFEDVAKARSLIKSIEELRAAKLLASLRELDDYHAAVSISNVSAAEVNGIRFIIQAMKKFSDFKSTEVTVTTSSQPSQFTGSL